MKTIYKFFAMFIAGLLILTGCENPFELPVSQNTEKGTFSLEIDGIQTGRTILPTTIMQSDFALYTLVFSSSGRDNISVDRTTATLSNPISLDEAIWNLKVTAFLDSGKTKPVAQGSLEGIEIRSGDNTSRSLELKAIIEEGATGTFSWNIAYPTDVTVASVVITPLDPQMGTSEQTLYFIGGTPGADTIADKNNSSSPLTLNTGYYQVVFNLSNGERNTGRVEYLHIYKNMESQFAYTFTYDHFTVYSVTNGNDSGPGSLRHAIENAASNSTIYVEDGVGTITLNSYLSINKSLTIQGNGITIIRNQLSIATGAEVKISRVHIKDVRAMNNGAAIYTSGNLTLESCIFSGNQAERSGGGYQTISAYGGAIYNSGTLNVKACTFYNNSCTSINTSTGDDSRIRANSYGGAIYNSGGTLTLTGNLFYGNRVSIRAYYGGNATYPVVNSGTSGGYNVTDVALGTENNQSGWTAVASDKYVSGAQVAPLSFRLLSGSQTVNVITTLPSGYPTVDFYGNPISNGAAAGAVQATASGYLVDVTVNSSTRGSAAITTTPNDDGFYSGSTTITATPATGYGCYWLVNDAIVDITNPLVLNIATHTSVQAVFARIVYNFTSDSATEAGTLRNATTNVQNGDIIYLSGVEPGVTTITLSSGLQISSVTNVTIEGNGVTLTASNSNLMYVSTSSASGASTIKRVHFKNGKAATNGAAINISSGTLTLESCIFSGNQTSGSLYTPVVSNGGAIYNSGGTLYVKGCTFYNNKALITGSGYSYGGAIYNYNRGRLYLTGNLFYGNTADRGSAVYNDTTESAYTYVTSSGYNVVDRPLGSATNQSGWDAETGDKYITTNPLTTDTLQPYADSGTHGGALGVITNLPTGYPVFDFYGDQIMNGAAAGAVQSIGGDERPALTGTVDITGTLQTGQTITADTTNLGGSGTISYQWRRGATIMGTNNTYTVVAADVGSAFTLRVTRASNSGYMESLPMLTGTVSINGNIVVGQTLTAVTTGLGGDGNITYQWRRGTTVVGSNSTYTVVNGDEVTTFTLRVTRANNSGYIESLSMLTGRVSINGNLVQGRTLTAVTTDLLGSGTISYQWRRGDDAVGSNSSAYTVVAADVVVGTIFTLRVTRAGYLGYIESAPLIPGLTGTVSINGTLKTGQTLTAVTTSLGGSGYISYQWRRGDTVVGSNSPTYTVAAADLSSTFTLRVTRANNSGYLESLPLLPGITGTVSISGNIGEGQTLTADTTSLGGSGNIAYQWLRLNTLVGGGYIVVSTNSTYTVAANDVNINVQIFLRVTRTDNSGYVESLMMLNGTIRITQNGQTLSVNHLNLGGSGDISYQWRRGTSAAIIGTNSTYTLLPSDTGYTFTVIVTRADNLGELRATFGSDNNPPLNGTVSITGIAQVGQTLSVNTTNLGGNGAISYQWRRGSNTTNIGTGITYTLLPADIGYTITVIVTRTDNSGDVRSSTAIISGETAVTTESLPYGAVGRTYSQALAAAGHPPITWSLESGALPAGLSLAPTTGVISGTPTAEGISTFTVKATNAVGNNTKQLSITIGNAPTISTAALPNGEVGPTYNHTLTTTGATPITWSLDSGTLPAGLSLSGTGVISGTPTTAGISTFTVKATNAFGNDTIRFSITIGTAPAITTASLPYGAVGIAYNQALAATGSTPITWSLDNGTLPAGLSLSASGVIFGTPTTPGGYSNTSYFTVRATNAVGGNTKALSITIGNIPAITTTSLMFGTEGRSYSQTLEASGQTPITWSLDSGTLPAGLSLTPATGVISGLPFSTSEGISTFTVKATNAAGSDTRQLSITITGGSNKISMEMVQIQGGTFTMGNSEYPEARPEHMVTLTGFRMGKYEVTQAQYQAVMGYNPSWLKTPVSSETSTADRPVERVTWYDALEFCNKLSEIEGLTPVYAITDIYRWQGQDSIISATVNPNWSANGYRLPTEAQWEYACRAGTTTTYNTGDTISDNTGWWGTNSDNRTHSVGGKPANAWGLYDMHGNVAEWCWDVYGRYWSDPETDPMGPWGSEDAYRVLRGGAYGTSEDDYYGYYLDIYLRSASRDRSNYTSIYSGFRIVRPAN